MSANPPVTPGPVRLDPALAAHLRAQLPALAEATLAEIVRTVPSYADALAEPMGATIATAVQMALAGFLDLAARPEHVDPGSPLGPTLEGAYALGRGEARGGRSMNALLAAYRVGARVAWRALAGNAVAAGLDPQAVADFAELVFAYIDQLSAASVSGHSDELATTGRVRRRYLEQLAGALLDGAAPDVLVAAADRAGWTPPETLTAVLVLGPGVFGPPAGLPPTTLQLEQDPSGSAPDATVLLVPDAAGPQRPHLLHRLADRSAVVGPARPWTQVRGSYQRAVRAVPLVPAAGGVIDTEQHLPELVLTADPDALADLRARMLAPLADLRPDTAAKLTATLRAWLLHHGRRDNVATDLFVHPQTVRYRMSQLRERYGDRLTDPDVVLGLTLALALDPDL